MIRKISVYMLFVILIAVLFSCRTLSVEKSPSEFEIQQVIPASETSTPPEQQLIKIGFVRPTGMHYWDSAVFQSVVDTFDNAEGFMLMQNDTSDVLKVDNVTDMIHDWIKNGVEYLVYYPMDYGNELNEIVVNLAMEANVGIILIGNSFDLIDDSFYSSAVANDYSLEGKMAEAWLYRYLKDNELVLDDVRIAHLACSNFAAVDSNEIKRSQALKSAVDAHPGWTILDSKSCDNDLSIGERTMAQFLEEYPDITVVYADNEYAALGAIEAIKSAGKEPGSDIIVMTFGGEHIALKAIVMRELTMTVGVNPIYGPKVREIIRALDHGEEVDKVYYLNDRVIDLNSISDLLPHNGY